MIRSCNLCVCVCVVVVVVGGGGGRICVSLYGEYDQRKFTKRPLCSTSYCLVAFCATYLLIPRSVITKG